jgi:hypothetical protein
MERHRFFVEVFTRPHGPNGAISINSQDQFETVIECRNPNEGERMLKAQYGGNALVNWRGRA